MPNDTLITYRNPCCPGVSMILLSNIMTNEHTVQQPRNASRYNFFAVFIAKYDLKPEELRFLRTLLLHLQYLQLHILVW